MTKKPKTFSPQEKTIIAVAAIKGDKTIAQISSEYQVHPTQIGLWRRQALANMPEIFKDHRKKEKQQAAMRQDELDNLYKTIGQRDIELDWLKKKLSIFNQQ